MQVPITAVILAGGRATRMGEVDKGLQYLHGKPLVQHVIERLQPQVADIAINANRNLATYTDFGLPVLLDEDPNFIGPLAGFLAGLRYMQHDYLLTVPCDAPFLPKDLAARLLQQLTTQDAEIAVAASADHVHSVISLCKYHVLPSLLAFITGGQRKVSTWQKNLRYIEVKFNDADNSFSNINTVDDLHQIAQRYPNRI